ncbi:MAG: hypothetical protein NWR62_00830 [Crocinitomicaceae bacterium]|nr:hypothetical protein [Crocinitomicaceae bacterium]
MKYTEAHIAHLILTYHEGTLSPAEKTELEALLLENPELALDLEAQPSLISVPIQIDTTSFLHPLLEDLAIYQDEEGHPFDKLAIGSLEGQLNEKEQAISEAYAQDTHYQKVQKEVALTQLHPDAQIAFPNPESLLKTPVIRQLNWRPYALYGSSAAALLIAVFLINQGRIVQPPLKSNTQQQARLARPQKTKASKAIQVSPAYGSKSTTSVRPSQVVHLDPKDCIIPEYFEGHQQEVFVAQVPTPNVVGVKSNPSANTTDIAQAPVSNQGSAFEKSPVTIKAFLLQKTNERIFGTAAPSTDLKFETLARYASESVGIPVRYEVEEANDHDKLVFQLGPFTIEKTRTKK